ncbi:MAG TPA: N-acetyl-gamma-glutamyl-phosphate reductase [Mycobacteriales bacterium]|nr:N-acetyl-gamma-glutamyl-phosphate reductase [Mycobacteriales bacterium]
MGLTAAVAGASGYAGGELIRLLSTHPDLTPGALAAGTQAGMRLGDVHPHLVALADVVLEATEPARLAEADVVFLALPHGESARLLPALRAAGAPRVVDLGADFRLRHAADWTRWYGGTHPAPGELGHWPYGVPELPGARARIAGARGVASAGCYPTAVTLALAPLLAAGLVEPTDLVVVAASGTSGAGRSASARLLGSEVMGDVSAYKVATHQHTPEITQALADLAPGEVTLSFTTLLAPMPRGILATCTARLVPGVDEAALRDALMAAYGAEPFVHLLPRGRWPRTAATVGGSSCHLQVAADQDAGRAVVVAAIDNLGKGAAGQAVQCANLMLGLPEAAGLRADGVAP